MSEKKYKKHKKHNKGHKSLKDYSNEFIAQKIVDCEGNFRRASEELNVSRQTLWAKRKEPDFKIVQENLVEDTLSVCQSKLTEKIVEGDLQAIKVFLTFIEKLSGKTEGYNAAEGFKLDVRNLEKVKQAEEEFNKLIEKEGK